MHALQRSGKQLRVALIMIVSAATTRFAVHSNFRCKMATASATGSVVPILCVPAVSSSKPSHRRRQAIVCAAGIEHVVRANGSGKHQLQRAIVSASIAGLGRTRSRLVMRNRAFNALRAALRSCTDNRLANRAHLAGSRTRQAVLHAKHAGQAGSSQAKASRAVSIAQRDSTVLQH